MPDQPQDQGRYNLHKLVLVLLALALASFLLLSAIGPLFGEYALILLIPMFFLVPLPIGAAVIVSFIAFFRPKTRKLVSVGVVAASLLATALLLYFVSPSVQVVVLRFAAKRGVSSAQLNLGERYLHGIFGVDQNEEKGVYWLTQAAETGNLEAQLKLGIYYLGGNKDLEKARFWLERLANSNSNGWERDNAVNRLHLVGSNAPSK